MSSEDVVEIYSSEDEKMSNFESLNSKAPETIDLSRENISQDTCSRAKKRKQFISVIELHSINSAITEKTVKNNNDVIQIDDATADAPTALSLEELIDDFDEKGFTFEFIKFLEVCLKYDNSDGMKRIVLKNLIPRYCLLNDSYKVSHEFQLFLGTALRKLQQNPGKKFSCLKEVSEHFKSKIARKKVSFVTLDTEVSDKTKQLYTQETSHNKSKKDASHNVSCVIDLDDIEDEDVMEIQETSKSVVNKENALTNNRNPNIIGNVLLVKHQPYNSSQDDTNNNLSDRSPTMNTETLARERLIKFIESDIGALKKQLDILEASEVTEDSTSSPYLCCDNIQRRIVKLYTKLLTLRGEEPRLKPKNIIMIKVAPGYPTGPAREVQRWLNTQTDDGHPRFPNLRDVFKCVAKANVEDGLGLTAEEQWRQATQLFTATGARLQRQRRRREWLDLLRRADPAALGSDPAESDPALRARLAANRARAKTQEEDILQRYAMLEEMSRPVRAKKVVAAEEDDSLSPAPPHYIEIEVPGLSDFVPSLRSPRDTPDHAAPTEDVKPIIAPTEDVKPIITPLHIDPSTEILCSDSEDYSTQTEESDVEFDLPDDCLHLFTPIRIKEESAVKEDCGVVKEKSGVVKEESGVVDVKTEQQVTREDTLTAMLQFDPASLAQASVTTIFEEPTVFLEVSSFDEDE